MLNAKKEEERRRDAEFAQEMDAGAEAQRHARAVLVNVGKDAPLSRGKWKYLANPLDWSCTPVTKEREPEAMIKLVPGCYLVPQIASPNALLLNCINSPAQMRLMYTTTKTACDAMLTIWRYEDPN